jgi:hypothetical protein
VSSKFAKKGAIFAKEKGAQTVRTVSVWLFLQIKTRGRGIQGKNEPEQAERRERSLPNSN